MRIILVMIIIKLNLRNIDNFLYVMCGPRVAYGLCELITPLLAFHPV